MAGEMRGERAAEIAARPSRARANHNGVTPRYLHAVSERLVELTGIGKGASVLDVRTDSGSVAIRGGQDNVLLWQIDVERLNVPDSSVDVVTWRLNAFFLPDLIAGLRESWRVGKPSGRVGVAIPGPTNTEPMRSMYLTRLKSYGVLPAHGEPVEPHAQDERTGRDQAGRQRVGAPEACYDALRGAGFRHVEVRAEQLGCYVGNAGEWWEIVRSVGLGSFHACLSRRTLSRFKAEHLAEVARLATSRGIWLDLAVIFAVGWK